MIVYSIIRSIVMSGLVIYLTVNYTGINTYKENEESVLLLVILLIIISKVVDKIYLKWIDKKYGEPIFYVTEEEFKSYAKVVYKKFCLVKLIGLVAKFMCYFLFVYYLYAYKIVFEDNLAKYFLILLYWVFKILTPIVILAFIWLAIDEVLCLKDGSYNLEDNYCKECGYGAFPIIKETKKQLIKSEEDDVTQSYSYLLTEDEEGHVSKQYVGENGYKAYIKTYRSYRICKNCHNAIEKTHVVTTKERYYNR